MKDKRKTQGRWASLPDEMSNDVDKRLGNLNPWVPSFSAYVQRLIYLDLTYGLLNKEGGPNEEVINKAKGKRPFNVPAAPFISCAW